MSYDLFMNHKKAKRMVNKKGWDEFFNHISEGADGDVLIGWEGVHDKC